MQATLVIGSWAIGIGMIMASFFVNRRTGGDLGATPLKYTPIAQFVFFGGIGINLLMVAIAKVFWVPFP